MNGDGAPAGGKETGPLDVLAFWRAAGPDRWFERNADFDAEVAARFGAVYAAAAKGELAQWEAAPDCALALAIVLDQFSRNMFRDTPGMFASDPRALEIALEGIARGDDRELAEVERAFLYMPLMHSEDRAIQERSVALFTALGRAEQVKYAEMHRDIVARFGRFPHRNAILGRTSTPDEVEFLTQPGSSF